MSQGGGSLIFLVLFFVLMYFMLIRPQKKREKETDNMRRGVKVGDEIITIGGICGKVVKAKDDVIVIQTGSDKVKLEMMRWSVSKVVTASQSKENAAAQEAEEPKKALPKRLGKKSEESEAGAENVSAADIKSEEASEAVEAETVSEVTADETAEKSE